MKTLTTHNAHTIRMRSLDWVQLTKLSHFSFTSISQTLRLRWALSLQERVEAVEERDRESLTGGDSAHRSAVVALGKNRKRRVASPLFTLTYVTHKCSFSLSHFHYVLSSPRRIQLVQRLFSVPNELRLCVCMCICVRDMNACVRLCAA